MSLTASTLVEAQVLADKMWKDSTRSADYQAEVNSAKAIIENTTAELEIVQRTDKTLVASAKFSTFCDEEVNDEAPASYCSFTGSEANSGKKDYEITKNVNKAFSIDEGDYKDNFLDYASVFADNMLKTMKSLDEKVAQAVVASVQSFASDNLFTGGIGCPNVVSPVDWSKTYIRPNLWAPNTMGYFKKVQRFNKFKSPFLLDGGNLYDHFVAAMNNEGNAEGKGAAAWFKMMKYYEDLVNVAEVADGSTFMVERGAVAFASKAFWGGYTESAPKVDADGRRKFSIPSKNLPGVKYDVYLKETCSGKFTKSDVLFELNYDILNGPANCNEQTGVLEFVCGACPS